MAPFLPTKPKLIVEVCLGSTDSTDTVDRALVDSILNGIRDLLRTEYPTLELGQDIPTTGIIFGGQLLNSIKITDYTGDNDTTPTVDVSAADLEVQVFRLFDSSHDQPICSASTVNAATQQDEGGLPQTALRRLPNLALHGIFDSLLFDNSLQHRLLNSLIRMINLSNRQLQYKSFGWNRLVLLHGPVGTGKTSLCRALAQKLSIRLGHQYPRSTLIELDAQSLYSKSSFEDGKHVGNVFGAIEALLEKDKDSFMVVFVDEIEPLTLLGDEPRDALRAINTLLVALDPFRSRLNVIILCTCNQIKRMDHAFLDRADIKQYIPLPSPKIRYEIFRSCYLDLAKCGIIAPITHPSLDPDFEMLESSIGSFDTVATESNQRVLNDKILPQFESMRLHFWSTPDSPARRLWDVAEKCDGMSGRTLRRLPVLGLAMYTDSDPCPIEEALVALEKAADDEGRRRLGS